MTQRRRLVASVFVGLLGLAACSGDGDGDGGTRRSTAPGANGAPSELALATLDGLLTPLDGHQDCGTIAADSGWPTTFVHQADPCLLAALADGRPATLTLTGRDGAGAALLTRFVVVGAGELEVRRTTVGADGTVTETVASCRAPDRAWVLDIAGSCPVA